MTYTIPDEAASPAATLVAVDGKKYPLESARIAARAGGGIALTTLTQTYANPHDESLEVWAAKVAAAATPAELELMIGVYRDTANNRRLGQDDRRLARRQALALRKKQKQNS